MNKKRRISVAVAGIVALIGLGVLLLHGTNVAIFNSQGVVAKQERDLIVVSLFLSLIVVIPVFFLTFAIAWRYRESNTKASYLPDWDHNRVAETVWWLIPLALISALGIITWQGTHKLDPFRPISSTKPELTIQVVALEWKWLFIYPEQGVASLNAAYIPVDTPVDFEITADAPMNSLWIPQLGGQIYAMPGMTTHLHLMADKAGQYRGSSANISGKGFAGMHFITTAASHQAFTDWVHTAKDSRAPLNFASYRQLAQPSEQAPVTNYSSVQANLFDAVVNKYMQPGNNSLGDAR